MPDIILPRKNLQEEMLKNGLTPVYCSACGRFLGYEYVKEGLAYWYCKNGHWSVLVRGDAEMHLTGEEIYDRLIKRSRGQEG